MHESILRLQYPRGALPCRGFRCSRCGEEALLAGDSLESRRMAERLGLYGLQERGTRKLLRTGNSLAVSLDPELVRQVLGDIRPGDPVRVGREGKRIVIEPVAD